jgi:sporulation protein YabP
MPFEEREMPHTVVMEGRQRLSVTGVEEVESFDESTVVTVTAMGALVIRGAGLHIETLSLDGGELKVEGEVDSLTYETRRERGGGLFARLFR